MGTNPNPASQAASFSREIPARLDAIPALTGELSEWAAAGGASVRTASSMALMLDELVTNVVMHGYRGGDGRVQLLAAIGDGRLVVTLRDQAPAFNPLDAREPDTSLDVEEREIGGLGMHLVRTMADELSYRRIEADGTNELRIAKRL